MKIYGRQFASIIDSSDQPHAITAALSGCHAIVTYDSHFDAIENQIAIHTPESLLREIRRSN